MTASSDDIESVCRILNGNLKEGFSPEQSKEKEGKSVVLECAIWNV